MFAIFISIVFVIFYASFRTILECGLKPFLTLLEIAVVCLCTSTYNFVVMAGFVLFLITIFH